MENQFARINRQVSQFVRFTPAELDTFNQLLQVKTFRKRTFLLQAGEICTFEAYVVKGALRSFFIDDKGAEVILTFAQEDWWISDIASFQDQQPSRMFIETLEDCDLLVLTPRAKETLLESVPGFERVFRLLVQRHLAAYQERLFGNIARTAEARYLDFLQRYPTLPQRVPQHLIAAYLGISPEFLSKIRAKLAKK